MKAKREELEELGAALTRAARAVEPGAPEWVERKLVAAVRSRNRRRAAARLSAAGLAAALVCAGVFVSRPADPVLSAPVPAAPPAAAAIADAKPAAVAPAPARQRRAPRPPAAVEPANEFIPVGPWQAIEPMERGSIVRVRMPKASLPAMGIPVSAERWNESIPAEVLLGEDGTMRAVRFVNTLR